MQIDTKDWVLEQHQQEIVKFIEDLVTRFKNWKRGEIAIRTSVLFCFYDIEIVLQYLKSQQKLNYRDDNGALVFEIWIENLQIDCEYSSSRKHTKFNPET